MVSPSPVHFPCTMAPPVTMAQSPAHQDSQQSVRSSDYNADARSSHVLIRTCAESCAGCFAVPMPIFGASSSQPPAAPLGALSLPAVKSEPGLNLPVPLEHSSNLPGSASSSATLFDFNQHVSGALLHSYCPSSPSPAVYMRP